MSEIIGHHFCKKAGVSWEIWSDGRAYADDADNIACYRHQDGKWRFALVRQFSHHVEASEELEDIFQRYINGIIVGPIDPHRHLRKK